MEMDKLRVRCPCCSKLYVVDKSVIVSSEPEFECLSCATLFTFKYPPLFMDRVILAKTVKRSQYTQMIAGPENLKTCPKCGSQVHLQASECHSCEVVFEKIKNLPLAPHLRASPKLVRHWERVFLDYENLKKHHEFMQACSKGDALAFALYKYHQILEVQPFDEIAMQMKNKALEFAENMTASEVSLVEETNYYEGYRKWIIWGPLFLAMSFIVYGMLNVNFRNLVGIGSAISVFSFGLTYLVTGNWPNIKKLF